MCYGHGGQAEGGPACRVLTISDPWWSLGPVGALAAPPTVKPSYRHQGECELEPERMAGSAWPGRAGGEPVGTWQEAFPESGSGVAHWWHLCGSPWGRVQQYVETRSRAGGGGWGARQKGSLASHSSPPAPYFALSVPCCSSSILWIFLGSEACIFLKIEV